MYVNDAYNSLSIEGYRVSAEHIEKVRSGKWNSAADKNDRDQRDALAARGYWQAFQAVKASIKNVLGGANAGQISDDDHTAWYRELFAPSVTAGIVQAADLAGYRNGQVYIRRSMHTPPNVEAVRDLMPALSCCRRKRSLAHGLCLGALSSSTYTRIWTATGEWGRFLMNLMMASGGYPWTIVPLERRKGYMSALESASAEGDISPFAKFVAELVSGGTRKKGKGRA